ncbi:MAG: hypothetical protein U0625_06305 [Phycisphaerales bacterium]
MHSKNRLAAGAALVAAACATAYAHHHHVTVRTATGTPGEQLTIVVGYYAEEADLTIDPKTLQILDGGKPFVVALPTLATKGPLAGTYTGDGLSLTSDFFSADGVLDGAEIEYELVAVTPVEGPACDGVWCTTDPETGVVSIEAMSGGATRADRSLHVGFDGHPHGQLLGVTQEGEYDLTLVAWDANGVFLDSDPVIVRVHAHVPTPDFNGDGMVDGADLGFLLGSWGTHEADLDGDGMTDGADLGILLGAWG